MPITTTTYTYYDRNLSHPNLGYVYRALGNGLDVEATWPESDIEMIDIDDGRLHRGASRSMRIT